MGGQNQYYKLLQDILSGIIALKVALLATMARQVIILLLFILIINNINNQHKMSYNNL